MPRAKAPASDGCPLCPDDLGKCEEALRQLEAPRATIAWCERAGIPIEAAKRDLDDLTRFFQGVLAASRGPQASNTGAP